MYLRDKYRFGKHISMKNSKIFLFLFLRFFVTLNGHVGMAPHTKLPLSNDTDENRGLTKLPPKMQTCKMCQMVFY